MLFFLSSSFRLSSCNSQTLQLEEQTVRETLNRFKEGIEKGDLEEYTQLITTIMEHRAQHCGLDIELSFEDTFCRIKIKRGESALRYKDCLHLKMSRS